MPSIYDSPEFLFSNGDKTDYLTVDQLVSFLNEVSNIHSLTLPCILLAVVCFAPGLARYM